MVDINLSAVSKITRQLLFLSFSVFLLLNFISCTNKNELPTYQSTLSEEIVSFNDSIFFGQLGDLELYDGLIFLSDKNSNRVFFLDSNFQYLGAIGDPGPGPNEIKGIKNISIADSSLYIQDLWGGKILNYSFSGKLLNTLNISFDSGDFAALNSEVMGQVIGEYAPPFTKYSIEGVKNNFGKSLKKEDGHPSMHLRISNEKIITANLTNRLNVDVYDLNGNLLKENNLSQVPIIKQWLKDLDIQGRINSSTKDTKYSQTTFYDIDIVNDYVFFALPPLGPKDGVKKNYIIEAKINSDHSLTVTRKILFDGYFAFSCFSISDDMRYLVGYNSSNGSLVKYKIN